MNAEESTMHALVAGGGIGGLAAALSLARQGYRVTVLERAGAFTELGAGIQLAPNAFDALDRLGVGRRVRERAVYIAELRFMDGVTGENVATVPVTERYRSRFANPYAVVHRVDLYQPLLEACGAADGIELVSGATVRSYAQDPSGVTVSTAEGRTFSGDLLVGADGIRSAIRGQLVGDGDPRICGHTIYRSVIPLRKVPEELRWNAVTLWAAPGWHFVHYVIGGGKYLNLAATIDDGAGTAVSGRPAPRDHVRDRFREVRGPARRLLELGEEWREWVLCDRDPVDVWTDGRVTLLGDAAHPMLQYAAQGACQSLEDAVVLGEVLGGAAFGDVPERLEKYNAERRRRTARIQLLAREMGEQLYHPAGEAARVRNAMLRSMGEDDMYQHMAWLHGARPLWEETP
ncbi:3-hydroxybenzoate 6-monooxygenase [Streptomyces sp. NBC_01264]|uniref:3-hydroxybenzoate 6-monooxygenase n=1 Tax=Streptomyces sp. NBC_01264 TaxID=2903804 RepID=UPI0022543A76|nr:3-hydroxybenzoate 6-monooxygenase [Streptomyces sp. NBC_01264]MCX4782816.1 3-hydroxybenzoate 6-monooxygenase [Streptomyces sp. NBC_01264]